MLTPIPVRPRPDHHGQQPGRASTRCAAASSASIRTRSITSASPHERGFGPLRPRRSRSPATSRSTRRSERAQGLQGRPDPRREVLRGHATSRRTPARRPSQRAERLLLGRLPRRDRGGDRDPAPLRQGVRREDAAPARRVRHVRGRARRQARREGRLHRRLRHVGGQDRRQARADREPLQGSPTLDPHDGQARRHLRQDGRRSTAQLRAAQTRAVPAPRGLSGAAWPSRCWSLAELGNTKNPYLDPREILRFNAAYLGWRAKRAANWVSGVPYLAADSGSRGGAAPE